MSPDTQTLRAPSPLATLLNTKAVSDTLFSYLTPASLIRTALTCRAAKLAVATYMQGAFDINKHLSRFFPDPVAFRSLQARTGSLISGSNALQFLNRTVYKKSDVDLYVPQWNAKVMVEFLHSLGYEYCPSPELPDLQAALELDSPPTQSSSIYELRGVIAVLRFLNPTLSKDGPLEVQVMTTKVPVECVLHFHSTCVMNVISFKAAYSLYPRATFEDRCTLVCTSDIKRKNIVFTKYGTRGWTICTRAMECSRWEKSSQSAFSRRIRRVADRFTWKLPLDMTGVDVPPPRFGALEAPDLVVGECWSLVPELPLVRYMGPSRPRFRASYAPRAGVPQYQKRFVHGARTPPRIVAARAIPGPEPPARSLRASAPAFQPRGIKALETITDVQAALRKYVELRPQVSESPQSRVRSQKREPYHPSGSRAGFVSGNFLSQFHKMNIVQAV